MHQTASSCPPCQTWPPRSYASQSPHPSVGNRHTATIKQLDHLTRIIRSLKVSKEAHLVLFLLDRFEVGLEVKVLLVSGAKQNAQHGFSWDLHSPQGWFLELTLDLSDLQIHIFNLAGKTCDRTSCTILYHSIIHNEHNVEGTSQDCYIFPWQFTWTWTLTSTNSLTMEMDI